MQTVDKLRPMHPGDGDNRLDLDDDLPRYRKVRKIFPHLLPLVKNRIWSVITDDEPRCTMEKREEEHCCKDSREN